MRTATPRRRCHATARLTALGAEPSRDGVETLRIHSHVEVPDPRGGADEDRAVVGQRELEVVDESLLEALELRVHVPVVVVVKAGRA